MRNTTGSMLFVGCQVLLSVHPGWKEMLSSMLINVYSLVLLELKCIAHRIQLQVGLARIKLSWLGLECHGLTNCLLFVWSCGPKSVVHHVWHQERLLDILQAGVPTLLLWEHMLPNSELFLFLRSFCEVVLPDRCLVLKKAVLNWAFHSFFFFKMWLRFISCNSVFLLALRLVYSHVLQINQLDLVDLFSWRVWNYIDFIILETVSWLFISWWNWLWR